MKENFAILTDAGGDFTREVIKKYGIEETPLSTVVWPDGTEKPTDLYCPGSGRAAPPSPDRPGRNRRGLRPGAGADSPGRCIRPPDGSPFAAAPPAAGPPDPAPGPRRGCPDAGQPREAFVS